MKKEHTAPMFSKKQESRVVYLYEENKNIKLQTLAWKLKLSRLLVNISLNLTHFITRPNLAWSYSVASNDRSFFRFWYSTKPRQTTRHKKSCINFVGRYEICRVWDVSLSHYPSSPQLRNYVLASWKRNMADFCKRKAFAKFWKRFAYFTLKHLK